MTLHVVPWQRIEGGGTLMRIKGTDNFMTKRISTTCQRN